MPILQMGKLRAARRTLPGLDSRRIGLQRPHLASCEFWPRGTLVTYVLGSQNWTRIWGKQGTKVPHPQGWRVSAGPIGTSCLSIVVPAPVFSVPSRESLPSSYTSVSPPGGSLGSAVVFPSSSWPACQPVRGFGSCALL